VRVLRSPHDRAIAALAVPALGALVADPILSLVDTAFMGRVGTQALAALGVAGAVFAVAFFVFNFLEYGTTTAVAAAVGRNDLGEAGRATVTAMVIAVGAGCGAAVALIVAAGPVVRTFVTDPAVRTGAITYVSIRALAAPAVLVVRAGHGAYRGYHDTRTPFRVALGINAVNLVLDPLLIFGMGWGIAGAAWATLAAQYAGAATFLALLRRGGGRFGLVPGTRPVMREVTVFVRVGRDLAIRSGALLAAFTMATAVAARISDTAVAAHQVLFGVFIFLALALDALAIAAQAMVGSALGRGDRVQAREVADRVLGLGLAVGLGLTAALAGLEPLLPGWFTTDPKVRDAIRSAYPILVVSQPVAAAVFAWDGVFIGAGDYGYLAVSTLGAAGASLGMLAGVTTWGWGLPGVWWGIGVLLVGRGITLGWRRVGPGSPLRRSG
jgi:putative MATE family efflux protein